jgi:hypothetical protein
MHDSPVGWQTRDSGALLKAPFSAESDVLRMVSSDAWLLQSKMDTYSWVDHMQVNRPRVYPAEDPVQ